MRKLFLFLFVAASQLLSAQNYTVGTQTITYTDPARSNRSVGVDFRYPGTNSALTQGQFPFVIFAHGFSMDQTPYYPYADSLAKRGYIVGLLTTETGLSPSHANFAQDLLFVYNKLISEGSTNNASIFYQKVVAKGAIGGHSMGGGSTVLSAQYGNPEVCCFTFAAATTNPSSITAAPSMTKPYLSFGGSLDCIAPVTTNQAPMYDSSGSPCKFLVNITGGLHCQYGNANTACSFGEGFSGCASSSLSRQQQIDKTLLFLIPFLDYYLKGDCAAWTRFEQVYSANTTDVLRRNCTNTVPSNPAITGTTSFCAGGNTTLTASPAGFSYTWSDATTTATNTVSSAGSYGVTISNGVCSVSATPVSVVQNSAPAATGLITASDTVCSGISNISLSVATSASATTYNWLLPSGWSVTGGSGTNTIQATSGTNGGTISVTAENTCGAAVASAKQVVVVPSNLSPAGQIFGAATLCPGQQSVYYIDAVSGADSYQWTLPQGWVINTVADTNYIMLTPNTVSGNVSITAVNACGQGLPATLAVAINNPPALGAITGADTLCAGAGAAYTISAAAGADSYLWNLPAGWSVSTAADSNYIEITASQAGGTISVAAQNTCGAGAPATLNVAVKNKPVLTGQITGPDTLCEGMGTGVYFALSSPPAGTVDYNWSIPGDWSFIGGSNFSAPIANVNSSGIIAVYLSNNCGSSDTLFKNVVVADTPVVQIAANGNVLTASPSGAGYTFVWYLNGQSIPGATSATYSPAQNGNYSVLVTNSVSCSGLSAETAFVINGITSQAADFIVIYPNPNAGDMLYFEIPQSFNGGALKIIDVTGRVVKQMTVESAKSQISLYGLSKGTYIFSAENKGQTLRKNFTIR